jgi:ATP-binding cassette, subfamily B, bacterial
MENKESRLKPSAFLQIFHFIRPRMRGYLTGFIVFALTEASFYLGIPLTIRFMLDAAVDKDAARLWRGLAFVLAVAGAGGVSFVVFMYVFAVNVVKITGAARKATFGHALELPARYFEKNHSGDIVSRLTNDINALKNSYDWPLWNFAVTLLAGAGAVVAMVVLEWRVSLLLIGSSAAFAFLNERFAGSIKRISAEIQKSSGRLTESMGNILGGFAVIKQYRLEGRMMELFEVENRAILERTKARALREGALDSFDSLIGWINFGGIIALGAVLAGRGFMSFGTMVAMTNLLWNVNRMIRESGSSIARFQGFLAGAARVIELQREGAEPEEPASLPYPGEEPGSAVIEMRDVSFSYEAGRKALDRFSLRVDEGRTAALVGPSGGGKSTVCKLLLGFYPPDEGRIRVRGRAGEPVTYRGLREMIAYVPQEPFMFDGTVSENIGCGKPGAGTEEIVRAARSAYAHDFIMGMEKGYDTVVGERGVKLSGGQRQRIALARAFLKDAPVLLLDEATSSLDSRSEQAIQASLKELGERKTVIVIAHRLSTVENADVIYVIDHGRVAEAGRHGELLARGGTYARLHEIQFKLAAAADADRVEG